VDADSVASRNLLEAFAARIQRGAHAIQVRYGVLNPATSWRTRLMTIAQAAFHDVRSRARERLSLSCGIRGNGWCVTHALLARVPYRAFSLTEDVEYGIELGLSGYRVHYADDASVLGEVTSSPRVAAVQRRRWEGGRLALVRSTLMQLLCIGLRRRDRVCLDLALDLLVLPLTYVATMTLAFTVAAALASRWDPRLGGYLWLAAGCDSAVLAYVFRAWWLSATGARGLLDLAYAPAFMLWKVLVMLTRGTGSWVRTERERS
jgi:cellulose synthase/poly-beta-1,6-N-acetylglucosamine synthase-like glycosyltransferase